jgi:hypothetical protein
VLSVWLGNMGHAVQTNLRFRRFPSSTEQVHSIGQPVAQGESAAMDP